MEGSSLQVWQLALTFQISLATDVCVPCPTSYAWHRQRERALTAGGVVGGSGGAAAGGRGADRAHVRGGAGAVGGCADGESSGLGGAVRVGADSAGENCVRCM